MGENSMIENEGRFSRRHASGVVPTTERSGSPRMRSGLGDASSPRARLIEGSPLIELSLALTCAERSENRDDFASAHVARVRLCRGRARTERRGESRGYMQVREKLRGPAHHRPSTLNQRVQGSSP